MQNQETRITVKVQPGASKNEVVGLKGDALRLRIAAPPEKGKANKELLEFLRRQLDVPGADIAIISGQTSHQKVIAIKGLNRSEILKRLLPQANLLL